MPADSTFEDWVNKFLPPAIRLWTTIRVQGAFDPRKLCDQRQYEYTLPTHVFLGPKPSSEMGKWLEKARSTPPAVDGAEPQPPITSPIIEASAAFWSSQPENASFADDVAAKKTWRIKKEALDQAREFVKSYEGSHNFYNFTVGKDFRDRSCQRVMRKLEVGTNYGLYATIFSPDSMPPQISEPFVVNDTEYVSVSFLGQSFMLHQIVSIPCFLAW